MMPRKIAAYICLLIVSGVAVTCGRRPVAEKIEPGPLTTASLFKAVSAAGFQVREMSANIPLAIHPGVLFKTMDYEDSLLVKLRERYKLKDVVAKAQDEWQGQLLLSHWINGRIKNGQPTVWPENALEILDQAARGKEFWCSHFALTFMQCAQALGWQARKLGLDVYHGPETLGSQHHGAAEVWSNKFRKWIYIDSQSDLHFEKNGVPLSAWEIRTTWLENHGQGVDHVVGVPPEARLKNPAVVWWKLPDDETSLFFWLYYADNARDWNEEGAARFIFPQDSANAGLTWYQNDYENKRSRPHTGYQKKLFVTVDGPQDVYWTVGIAEATILEAGSQRLRLSLGSYCPNLQNYEYKMMSQLVDWQTVADPASVVWNLNKGLNSLSLRTKNKAGVTGPETSVQIVLE